MTIVEFRIVPCRCSCHDPAPIGLPSRAPCARCNGTGKLLWRATDDQREVEVMPLPVEWAGGHRAADASFTLPDGPA